METIKEIRAALGLTQQEFASRLGVAQARVSDWETGRHKPHWRTLEAAKALLNAGDKSEAA